MEPCPAGQPSQHHPAQRLAPWGRRLQQQQQQQQWCRWQGRAQARQWQRRGQQRRPAPRAAASDGGQHRRQEHAAAGGLPGHSDGSCECGSEVWDHCWRCLIWSLSLSRGLVTSVQAALRCACFAELPGRSGGPCECAITVGHDITLAFVLPALSCAGCAELQARVGCCPRALPPAPPACTPSSSSASRSSFCTKPRQLLLQYTGRAAPSERYLLHLHAGRVLRALLLS